LERGTSNFLYNINKIIEILNKNPDFYKNGTLQAILKVEITDTT
jgi:hypothetical protein